MFWPALLALLLTHCTATSSAPASQRKNASLSQSGKVVQLTELNFDQHVTSSPGSPAWMIDVYAPWCPACQDLEPVWELLAEELHPEIRVGKIDGTVERGLLTRFSVQHFPSIYHINGTDTREYLGGRTLNKLVSFAREGWMKEEPRTRCSSPVTRCGRLLGKFTRIPAQAKQYYKHLHEEKQYSDLTLVAALLAVPVVIGMTFICLLDAYYTRKPTAPVVPVMPAHLHHD